MLIAASRQPFEASSAKYGTCADCGVLIVQTDVAGPVVELAARGLVVSGEYRYSTDYPETFEALRGWLDDLMQRIRGTPDTPASSRAIPMVNVAPLSGG